MIDSSFNQIKSKLELKLIGPQSSRNQLRSSNSQFMGNAVSNQQNSNQGGYNTARTQQNITPKRKSSNHNGSINNNINSLNTYNSTNNFNNVGSGTPGSLQTQINNRLQGNSYLNKNNSNNLNKINTQNFVKKNIGLGSNLTQTKSNLNSNNNGYNSGFGNQQGNQSNTQDKMNNMKNNYMKQKNNSNMHINHKNQILQQYQNTQQQIQQQQIQYQQQVMQHQYLLQQQSLQEQQSMSQLLDITQSPSSSHMKHHLSPSTSSQNINSNETTRIKYSYLNKASPNSYLSSEGNNKSCTSFNSKQFKYLNRYLTPKFFKNILFENEHKLSFFKHQERQYQETLQHYNKNSKQISQYFLNNHIAYQKQHPSNSSPFNQGNYTSSTGSSQYGFKSPKCLTPISEKSKLAQQNSFLKKSQLVITKNSNSSNLLNTSSNNTSYLKQSHSRSPVSSNQIDKENTYLNNFDTSINSISDKSKRSSQIQSSSSHSQTNLSQSPFSYLTGQGSNNVNSLSPINHNLKAKQNKSPKHTNSVQMVSSSLEMPAGNFFTSHLNRKKNLSTQAYQSFTTNAQPHFDQSPINNSRRMNQLNKNENSEIISQNGQNSYLQSSNMKDSEFHNKTQNCSYNKSSGFLKNFSNNNRFDQYRSTDADNGTGRNFFPKTYLNIETKESSGILNQKKKNITLDGVELLSGIKKIKDSNINTENNYMTLNEQELSFQNDQEENIIMLMNQQNLQNTTSIYNGNSSCYGYLNDDESNFLNSTNFLNLTNLQINTQNNTILTGQSNQIASTKNGNNQANLNYQQPLQNMNGNNMPQQFQNNNLCNQYNHNNNNSIQLNNQNNTLNWANNTNMFNNSVCTGSILNTTINNILQNMNSAQSTTAFTTNNTIQTQNNPYVNNNNANQAKIAPNIYSSLTQQTYSNNNHTNSTATIHSPCTQPSTNTYNSNGNSYPNFASASNGYGQIQVSISNNSNNDKLPLDTTPKQVNLFPEPIPSKNNCENLKSVLYDVIMPTIKPITRQFKLLNSHQYNNSNGNCQNFEIKPNCFGNEQISNSNKQQILEQLTKQFSSSSINNNSICINNNLSSISENGLANSNTKTNRLNQSSIPLSNNLNESKINQNQQNENIASSFQSPSCNFLEAKQLLQEQIGSKQTTPRKMCLQVDVNPLDSQNNPFLIGNPYFADTPSLKSPSNQDENENTPSPRLQTPSSQHTPSLQNNNKFTFSNQQVIISQEKDQLSLQQYNFSFSNCVNQQKKIQQPTPQQQPQETQQQSEKKQQQYQIQIQQAQNQFLQVSPYKNEHQHSNEKNKQNNKNYLMNQEHKLVESTKQELCCSPEKPVINLLISQQITVVEGISQVSSQMFLMDQHNDFGSPFIDQSLVQNHWSIDCFQVGKCLGRGRFGNVYLSRHKQTNMLFAIKQISKKSLIESCMEKQLQQEIKIQTYLNHPNVLKMHGFFDDNQKIYLILELASHGDIYKEIKREQQKKFTEEKAANYIRQVCEGLLYLHSQGIIHRDIKPENILNTYGVLKLSDFGWSIYTEEKRMTFCGTLDYVSPEVVSGKDYDFKVDIWSIGVLTYELITGKPPFENRQNHNEAYQKILQVKYDFPNYISNESKDFMSKLLVGDPNKRISLEAALNHEWIIKNTRNCLADWDPKVSEESLYLLK